MIKSISYSQTEIISNILKLYNSGRSIDLDPCYNIGGFYKSGEVLDPRIKSDINPLLPGVLKLDVRALPFENSSIKSAIFDPPFLVSGGDSCKMTRRYGGFDSIDDLYAFYYDALCSLHRVLKHGGLLIFKFQDFVSGRKQHLLLPYIYEKARELNFGVRDLFICLSKNRIINTRANSQCHSRKYHCYFLVLKNNKRGSRE